MRPKYRAQSAYMGIDSNHRFSIEKVCWRFFRWFTNLFLFKIKKKNELYSKFKKKNLGFDDECSIGDFNPTRILCSKLDPISMLSATMHRSKGVNKGSPRRNLNALSPARLNGAHSPVQIVHNSTMIPTIGTNFSRINFSPLRKTLF